VTQTYSTQAVPRRPRIECHDCGASADILIVEDSASGADGYRGELPLCMACLRKREAMYGGAY